MDMSLWQPRDWLSGLRALDRHDWISPLLLGVGRMPSAPDWVAPEVDRGELRPDTIATEVFSSQPPGRRRRAERSPTRSGCCNIGIRRSSRRAMRAAKPGSWYHLGRRLKEKRAERCTRPRNAGLNALTWDYPRGRRQRGARCRRSFERDQRLHRGRPQAASTASKILKNDGSTACGAWIYCGVFPEPDAIARTSANRRSLGHGWGFAWPNDCRIIYNRASARPDGKPWSERKNWFGGTKQNSEWTGLTCRFTKDMPPDTQPILQNGQGVEALGGARPFTLHPDGVGWLYVPSGLKDGPLPAHYEPLESLFENPLYSQDTNPAAEKKAAPGQSLCRFSGRSALSLYAHHVPPDRASHRGRHDAHSFASG